MGTWNDMNSYCSNGSCSIVEVIIVINSDWKNKWQLSEPIALRSLFLALSRGPALSNTRCTRSINACATHTQHHRNNLKFDNQTNWCESSGTHHIHIQFLRLADGLLDSLTVVIFVGQEQHHSKGVGEQGDSSYLLFIYWHSQLQ